MKCVTEMTLALNPRGDTTKGQDKGISGLTKGHVSTLFFKKKI